MKRKDALNGFSGLFYSNLLEEHNDRLRTQLILEINKKRIEENYKSFAIKNINKTCDNKMSLADGFLGLDLINSAIENSGYKDTDSCHTKKDLYTDIKEYLNTKYGKQSGLQADFTYKVTEKGQLRKIVCESTQILAEEFYLKCMIVCANNGFKLGQYVSYDQWSIPFEESVTYKQSTSFNGDEYILQQITYNPFDTYLYEDGNYHFEMTYDKEKNVGYLYLEE